MQREVGAFSNPIAPERSADDQRSASGDGPTPRLTNADFRKLLMTPRASGGAPSVSGSGSFAVPKTPAFSNEEAASSTRSADDKARNASAKRRHFVPKSKREELERERELEKRYRDRARERRDREKTVDGELNEYFDESGNVNMNLLQSRSEYRAVPSSTQLTVDAQERRRQVIQESKFLGGDMEHTHLVKGLDFALLEKVRTEIERQDREIEVAKLQEEERAAKNDANKRASSSTDTQKARAKSANVPAPVLVSDSIECRSASIKKLLRVAFDYRPPERNELFAAGRMSFVFELDDAEAADLPVAVVRSRAEMALVNATHRTEPSTSTNSERGTTQNTATSVSTQSTNDIVMDKLIQILHGLRTGKRDALIKRGKAPTASKKQETETKRKADVVDSMFDDDVGDYVPDLRKRPTEHSSTSKAKRYFEPDRDHDRDTRRNEERVHDDADSSKYEDGDKSSTALERFKMRTEIDCYVECYPGMAEMDDALVDSDEEDAARKAASTAAGQSKDAAAAASRKRFDKQREVSSGGFFIAPGESDTSKQDDASFRIASSANGGAAERSDGANRSVKQRDRTDKRERSEKAALDREWAQIQAIMDRRKTDGPSSKARRDQDDADADDDDGEPAERREKRSKLSR